MPRGGSENSFGVGLPHETLAGVNGSGPLAISGSRPAGSSRRSPLARHARTLSGPMSSSDCEESSSVHDESSLETTSESDLDSGSGSETTSESDLDSDHGEVRPTTPPWQTALRACGQPLKLGLLRVLLPCAGWDAPSQALQAMRIPHVVAGAWEIDEACRPVLKKVHGIKPHADLPSQFHLGRCAGDVTRVQVSSLPDADLLVSGPPCPPFSTIGQGKHFSDSRADVFLAILRWIPHLARKSLRGFVLENVMGMLRQVSGGGQSPADRIIDRLKAKLKHWHIECLRMDSACTAQHRKRIYIVGYRCAHPASAAILSVPRLPQQTLADIVRRDVPNTPSSALPAGQRSNLRKYKRALSQEMHDGKRQKGQLVAIEIDRNPDRKWGPRASRHGRCMCLRAGHHLIFLLSMGSSRVHRLLTPEEGAALQGMKPELIPKGVSRSRLFKGLGNAMTVPVVGQALHVTLMGAQSARWSARRASSDSDDMSDGTASSSEDDLSSRSSDAMSIGSSSS